MPHAREYVADMGDGVKVSVKLTMGERLILRVLLRIFKHATALIEGTLRDNP